VKGLFVFWLKKKKLAILFLRSLHSSFHAEEKSRRECLGCRSRPVTSNLQKIYTKSLGFKIPCKTTNILGYLEKNFCVNSGDWKRVSTSKLMVDSETEPICIACGEVRHAEVCQQYSRVRAHPLRALRREAPLLADSKRPQRLDRSGEVTPGDSIISGLLVMVDFTGAFSLAILSRHTTI
jgi:hypothetical protein